VLNFRRLIDTQLKTKDGMLILPKTPGLGFGFDEKAVARYALKDGQLVWNMLKVSSQSIPANSSISGICSGKLARVWSPPCTTTRFAPLYFLTAAR